MGTWPALLPVLAAVLALTLEERSIAAAAAAVNSAARSNGFSVRVTFGCEPSSVERQ
jgi:hypothetical protein